MTTLDLGQLRDVPFDLDAPCLAQAYDWHADAATERRKAAILCQTCPLIIQCGMAAFARGERNGVWGGLDFDDYTRQGLRRLRAQTVKGRTRRKRALCGTKTGYDRHNRLREPACPACLRARADYSAARREKRRETA